MRTPQLLIHELEEGSFRTVDHWRQHSDRNPYCEGERDDQVIIGRISDDPGIVWVNESDEIVSLSESKANAEIAITGEAWETWQQSNPEEAASLTESTRVFGRCTPNNKVAVVTSFTKLDKVTMMCGDGRNDYGALKTAHVGVAFSDSEASIVAPLRHWTSPSHRWSNC